MRCSGAPSITTSMPAPWATMMCRSMPGITENGTSSVTSAMLSRQVHSSTSGGHRNTSAVMPSPLAHGTIRCSADRCTRKINRRALWPVGRARAAYSRSMSRSAIALALVAFLASDREGELDFDPALLEVEAQRHQRQTFFLDPFADLPISSACNNNFRGRSGLWAPTPWANRYGGMCTPSSQIAPLMTRAYASAICRCPAQHLHLTALEHEAGLEHVEDRVVEASLAVTGDVFLSFGAGGHLRGSPRGRASLPAGH